jgi:hypothetical protein
MTFQTIIDTAASNFNQGVLRPISGRGVLGGRIVEAVE